MKGRSTNLNLRGWSGWGWSVSLCSWNESGRPSLLALLPCDLSAAWCWSVRFCYLLNFDGLVYLSSVRVSDRRGVLRKRIPDPMWSGKRRVVAGVSVRYIHWALFHSRFPNLPSNSYPVPYRRSRLSDVENSGVHVNSWNWLRPPGSPLPPCSLHYSQVDDKRDDVLQHEKNYPT